MIKEIIGNRVKEIWIFKVKISQEELSYLIGRDRSFLSRIESGKQNISVENLNLLCNGLGVTLSDFFLFWMLRLLKKMRWENWSIEWYKEPYSANYFMQNNILKFLDYIPFHVTTGSGRSHGEYSIILKSQI